MCSPLTLKYLRRELLRRTQDLLEWLPQGPEFNLGWNSAGIVGCHAQQTFQKLQ